MRATESAIDDVDAPQIERRLAYRRAMEERLLSILLRFLDANEGIEAAIAAALGECAQFAGAQMGHVMRVSADGSTFSMSNMWRGHAVESDQLTVRDVPVSLFPAEIRAGSLLRVDDVNLVPDDLPFKGSLQAHGVSAVLSVPIMHGNQLLGAVGLSVLGGAHTWTEEEQLLLQFFAATLGQALLRLRAQQQQTALEEQLRRALDMEVAARTAAGIAHDFRNMLTVVKSCAELAASPTLSLVERRELLEDMTDAVNRASDLAGRLIRLGRNEPTKRSRVDVAQLLDRLLPSLRRLLPSEVTLELSIVSVPLVLEADPSDVEQALTNLCLNARDAILSSGTISIRAAHHAVEQGGYFNGLHATPGPHVLLSVCDDGSGVAPENLPRLFEPYFTTKAPERGSGLGLATVYAMCKAHGGWIDVLSSLERGSEFRIYLPQAQ